MPPKSNSGTQTMSQSGSRKVQKANPPDLVNHPELRQHKAPFFRDFLSKGISHEMQNSQRFIEADELGKLESLTPRRHALNDDDDDDLIVALPSIATRRNEPTPQTPAGTASHHQCHVGAIAREINKRKQFHLGGTMHSAPPFHVDGDDIRLKQSQPFAKSLQCFVAAMQKFDQSGKGRISREEFIKAIQSLEPQIERVHIVDMWRLVDPGGVQGRLPITQLANVFGRTIATKRSLRGSLASGNIVAWNSTDGDPGVSIGASLGRSYYGMRTAAPQDGSCHLPSLAHSASGTSPASANVKNSQNATTPRVLLKQEKAKQKPVPKPPAVARRPLVVVKKIDKDGMTVEAPRTARSRAGSPNRAAHLRQLYHAAMLEANAAQEKITYSGAASKFHPTLTAKEKRPTVSEILAN